MLISNTIKITHCKRFEIQWRGREVSYFGREWHASCVLHEPYNSKGCISFGTEIAFSHDPRVLPFVTPVINIKAATITREKPRNIPFSPKLEKGSVRVFVGSPGTQYQSVMKISGKRWKSKKILYLPMSYAEIPRICCKKISVVFYLYFLNLFTLWLQ